MASLRSLLQDLPELLPMVGKVMFAFCRGERKLTDTLGELSDRLLHMSVSILPSMSFWKSSAIASLKIPEFCSLVTWMQETVFFKNSNLKIKQIMKVSSCGVCIIPQKHSPPQPLVLHLQWCSQTMLLCLLHSAPELEVAKGTDKAITHLGNSPIHLIH